MLYFPPGVHTISQQIMMLFLFGIHHCIHVFHFTFRFLQNPPGTVLMTIIIYFRHCPSYYSIQERFQAKKTNGSQGSIFPNFSTIPADEWNMDFTNPSTKSLFRLLVNRLHSVQLMHIQHLEWFSHNKFWQYNCGLGTYT